ncbi:MAG: membrane dipeptidase [Proteobacteria bacterium]|nr:membrane dipeptidase [Pseudomonadota bacterium]
MLVDWRDMATGAADGLDGDMVEIVGWLVPVEAADEHHYFLLTPEPMCCGGCLPSDPGACVEVFAGAGIAPQDRAVRLLGRWRRLRDDPAGWRYQLRDARRVGAGHAVLGSIPVGRRDVLAAGAALALAACSGDMAANPEREAAARQVVGAGVTIDIHSHAGRILRSSTAFEPVAAPMRDGGMAAICLAMVADSPATRVMPDGRIQAVRIPAPGELYRWSRTAFGRVQELVEREGLAVITDVPSLHAARSGGPAVIVAAEGADFLDRALERVEEAYVNFRLRHLQLTHYRVNDLGDIQTEPPVHDGLTDFGAEVIRACNRLGIVVDVAHGTYDLVKRAATVTTKPLVLSHTSLSSQPGLRSRQISVQHARVISGTGGVVGIWPPSGIFRDYDAFVAGFGRMVDAVGIDHVGLGSDMLGLTSPSLFPSYRELPRLADALLGSGFRPDEVGKLLGGNYARVFAASVGS